MPVKNVLFHQKHNSKFIYWLETLKAWNRNKKDRISTSTVPEKPETTEASFIWSFAHWISPTYYHFTVGMSPETCLCPGDKSDQQTNHPKKQKYHHHLWQERCARENTTWAASSLQGENARCSTELTDFTTIPLYFFPVLHTLQTKRVSR